MTAAEMQDWLASPEAAALTTLQRKAIQTHIDEQIEAAAPNPIVSETPLRAYPGWTVRQYQKGQFDATNGTAITEGCVSFAAAVSAAKIMNATPAPQADAKSATSADLAAAATASKKAPVLGKDTPFPKVIQFLGITDGGPCDDGPTAMCPHCGADGRYIHWFVTDDGHTRGAMAGCVKLFPVSPIAAAHQKLVEKEADLMKRFGRDAHLNSWDTKKMQTIEAFYAGEITEADALRTISYQTAAATSWRRSKGSRF